MAKKNRELNRTERAAALRAEQERAERNRKIAIIGAVVVVIAIVAGAMFWMQGTGSKKSPVNTSMPASVGDHSLKIGPDDAAHKVVVWEDFLCPYCREFEQGSRDALHAAAENGSVQVEYRPFQLLQDDYSKHALAAFAFVLENGTPQEALALHDMMFDEQPYEQGRKPSVSTIAGWVKKVGLDKGEAEKAIEAGGTEWNTAMAKAASEAGVRSTPTVTVDGKPLEGASITDMINNLETQIAK